ncbi:cell division protein [Sphingomonas sp. AP4-R1]|uniref:cell division protein n=1 Tax=Sphingomonas sp. AP4-R1 TaxID=2735134 RepID=UPI0014937D82|nr:cell division protein [Sphingomonas sp. AP4-R1]QJU59998.1 cell division protein [Sphingomonas sp. AP4-R1]
MSVLPTDLLPRPGRRSALPWLIAAVAFLMALAAAAALALGRSADTVGQTAAGRITISIAEADQPRREAAAARALAILKDDRLALNARRVNQAEVRRLVAPYLGPGADLALPALIDADLPPGGGIAAVRAALTSIDSAEVDSEGGALTPLLGLIAALRRLSLAVLLLAGAVAMLVTVLVARAALAAHAGTIETLHGLGATDMQLARLVERRTALDALAGATIGLVPAVGVIVLVSTQLGALNGGDAAQRLPLADWGLLAVLPLLLAAAALLATRLTILRQLRRAI